MWKTIPDFQNYEVSDAGFVRRKIDAQHSFGPDTRGRILKPHLKNHYYQVVMRNADGKKYVSLHRLVAQAFVQNPDNLPCVNHKDENKLNNAADNLEWCTWAYNAKYGTGPIRRVKGHTRNGSPKAEQPVLKTLNGEVISRYESIAEAARQNNINESNIRQNLYGKSKHCAGFVWIREKEYEATERRKKES